MIKESGITGSDVALAAIASGVGNLGGNALAHQIVKGNKHLFKEEDGYTPDAGFLKERYNFFKKHPGALAFQLGTVAATTGWGARSLSKLRK